MACCRARPAASQTADRTSGCRNRTLRPSTSASPAATAYPRSATDTSTPATRLAAARTSASPSPSFNPAASNAVKVSSGNPGNRDANARSRRRVSGIHPSTAPPLPCCTAVSGSSTRASGFPAACASTRWRTTGSSTARASSSAAEASGSSGPSRNSGSPATASGLSPSSPTRAVTSSPTASAPSRRLMNASTSQVDKSRQWASSAITSSGVRSARPVSKSSAASPTTGMAGAGPSAIPRAVKSASRWPRCSLSAPATTGRSSWCSPASENCASPGTPAQASTRIPASAARLEAAFAWADFPIPGSPSTSSDPPPSAIPASSDSTTTISDARPTSSGAINGHPAQRSPSQSERPGAAPASSRFPGAWPDDLGAPRTTGTVQTRGLCPDRQRVDCRA